jgi:thioredoxin reductase/NAD-dependent dihydropyrimidine dehydrogenase PreA subunit
VLTSNLFLPLLVTIGSLVAFIVGIFIYRRSVQHERDTERLEDSVIQKLHIPPSLHPVIDPKRCIGSLSCIQVCPEGDILGNVNGKAVLIVAANCIGHGKCAMECPVDAISLVFGTAERGIDLPEVNEFFESSRAGVHIIGELGGMGLIKNATRQGIQVGEYLAQQMKQYPKKSSLDHALIVGAGPAGLAAAFSMKAQGLKFRIVTQNSLGGTIANYPRQKVVMTETVNLPIYGKFGKKLISKEELLHTYETALQKANIRVEDDLCVNKITGEDGNFEVETSKGKIKAQKVILAIGRMGTPRKLDVPGEEEFSHKITYLLKDPTQYNQTSVLVVGGGDSAVESAIMLAEDSNAKVYISCRTASFAGAKQRNKEKIQELIQKQKIYALMNSAIKEVRSDKIVLDFDGTLKSLKNDFVIVNIGGVLPTGFLQDSNISLKRHHGEIPKDRRNHAALKQSSEKKKPNYFVWGLTIVGIILLAYLYYVGRNYYWLPLAKRVRSPLHDYLKPGGTWGHGIGIVATLVMMSNFLYILRKNVRFLKGQNSIRNWLKFHMFVGFMSPVVILFHAAFQSQNLIATICYYSLLMVVGTGIVGRYFYGLVPRDGRRNLELSELLIRIQTLQTDLNPLLQQIKNPQKLHSLLKKVSEPLPKKMSFFGFFLKGLTDWFTIKTKYPSLRPLFETQAKYEDFCEITDNIMTCKRQAFMYRTVKNIMSYWRVVHVGLALILVIVIFIHIYSAIQMGAGWKL